MIEEKIYEENPQYEQRKTLFELFKDGETDIVFVGDSITEKCEWQEFYKDKVVCNRGIGSDMSEGVLNRLETVVDLNPKKIFIMIGINDLGKEINSDKTMANYQEIIHTLKKLLPESEIYIESILPVEKISSIKNEDVQKLNTKIKALSEQENLEYINLYDLMVDETNHLKDDYSVDGVHLTGEAYQIWIDAISEYAK
ncbi:MAG: GDSL-type esterase/lipase family protein [Eubacterium sp.]